MDTSSHIPAYDAFGDVAAAARPRVTSTRRERKITVVVFWTIATLLIAGRFYQYGAIVGPQAYTMAHPMEVASR